MDGSHLAAVVALEQHCGLSPWGGDGYRRELENQQSILLVAMVGGPSAFARANDPVVGFLAGRVVADEFQLYNLAVQAERRGQGIGSSLLVAGWRAAEGRGAERAVLEVRASNESARALYERHGFRVIGKRAGYYGSPPDDALMLICERAEWVCKGHRASP
jgi:ribosomal-protein-alanine N-acetyltransferase